jgi:hypothetical protein
MMPGRIRVKVPAKKGDSAYLQRIAEEYGSRPGIGRVLAYPETGSVLFLHELEKNKIMEHLSSGSLFRLELGTNSQGDLHQDVKGCFRNISSKVENATGGAMNISQAAFLALLGAGVVQLGRGNMTAIPWYTAFWYALNIFLKSDKPSGGE